MATGENYLYPLEKLNGIVGAVINDDGSLMIHTNDEALFGNARNKYPEYKGLGALFNLERIKNLEKFGKVSVIESLNEGEGFIKIEGLKMDVEKDEDGRIINKEEFQKILDNDTDFCRDMLLNKPANLMFEPKSKINTLEVGSEELNGNKYFNIDYNSYFIKKPSELTDMFKDSIGYMHDRENRQIKILADEENLKKLEELSGKVKINYIYGQGKQGAYNTEKEKEGKEGLERGRKMVKDADGDMRDDWVDMYKKSEKSGNKDRDKSRKKSNPNSLANVWRMAEGDEASRAIAGMLHHIADTLHAARQGNGLNGQNQTQGIGLAGSENQGKNIGTGNDAGIEM
jgi:hypothetical protein